MEITFQNTAENYRRYHRRFFRTQLVKRLPFLALYPLLAGVAAAGKPPNWTAAGITTLIAASVLFILFWLIPYFRSLKILRETLANPSFTEKKTITATAEGLQTESASGPGLFRYESILAVEPEREFVIVTLIDRKVILVPDAAFPNPGERVNFIGTLRSKMSGARTRLIAKTSKKSSLKRYAIVGAAGAIFAIAFYFYRPADRLMKKPVRTAVQTQLDNLVKEIEFFKIQTGAYPDSLQQLRKENSSIRIYDLFRKQDSRRQTFGYRNLETGYHLYSAGEDHMPDTQDDIYPSISPEQEGKLGLLRPER